MLDDAHFAEGALADGAEEVEVVEVDGPVKVDDFGLAADGSHGVDMERGGVRRSKGRC